MTVAISFSGEFSNSGLASNIAEVAEAKKGIAVEEAPAITPGVSEYFM